MSPFERQYDADELIELCREHDGLTTRELATLMDAYLETTRHRCLRLEEEGHLTAFVYGLGQTQESVWYVTD